MTGNYKKYDYSLKTFVHFYDNATIDGGSVLFEGTKVGTNEMSASEFCYYGFVISSKT